MIRGNQIGADVYNTTETELDKNNLSTQKSETEQRVAFPELGPGRALIDIETGELYEFMDRPVGMIDTVEGRQSESEEYFNWKYRTPEGQDWGGIIQHHYMSYAKRGCPKLNEHGEVQMPLTRPADSEMTTVSPPAFADSVLFDGEVPRPLLLVERPEVTYEEVIPGDTYEVAGWFDPSEANSADRTKPITDIVSTHPEIVDVDSTIDTLRGFARFDMSLAWETVADTDSIIVSASTEGGDTTFSMDTQATQSEFHIDVGRSDDEVRFLIQSPYEAKEAIKSLSSRAQWDSEASRWTVESSADTLNEMIMSFTAAGWDLSLSPRVVSKYGDSSVDITPEQADVSATESDVFEYIFTESVTIADQPVVPGTDTGVSFDDLATENLAIDPRGKTVDVTETPRPGANHISQVESDSHKIRFNCPRENAGLVKSLDWSDARYNWIGDDSQWELNQSSVGSLIEAFCDADKPVSLSQSGARQIAEEKPITDTRAVSPESPVTADVDSWSVSPDESPTLAEESSLTASDSFGVTSQSPNRLALMWIDMKIADERATGGMNVDLGDDPVPQLSSPVAKPWNASHGDDDDYEWHLPDSGARIRVSPVEGYGTEYELHVKTHHSNQSEHIVTLADERKMALAVITQMKCLTTTE